MDRRRERSREHLRAALIQLMHQKEFDDIQIIEITETADTAISTFYRNYANKLDLLKDTLLQMRHRVEAMVGTTHVSFETVVDLSQPSPILPIAKIIEADWDFFKKLFQTPYAGLMFSLALQIAAQKIRDDTPEWEPYEVDIIAANAIGNLCQWILLDLPYDAETISTMIHRTTMIGIMGLRGELGEGFNS